MKLRGWVMGLGGSLLALSCFGAGLLVGGRSQTVGPTEWHRRWALPASTSRLDTSPRPEVRWLLDYFAVVDEEALPTQGVLGGTMRLLYVVFPDDYRGARRDRYFVLASDGHVEQTWVFRGIDRVRPRRIRQGYSLKRFESGYDFWIWRPPSFAPFPQ